MYSLRSFLPAGGSVGFLGGGIFGVVVVVGVVVGLLVRFVVEAVRFGTLVKWCS